MTGVCPPAINISPVLSAGPSLRDYLLGSGPVSSYGVPKSDCMPTVQRRGLVLVSG